jgi:hypothetical protein
VSRTKKRLANLLKDAPIITAKPLSQIRAEIESERSRVPLADEYKFQRSVTDPRDYLGMVDEVVFTKGVARLRVRVKTGFANDRGLDPSVSVTLPASVLRMIAAFIAEPKE